jgi:PAS domain-containing protein
MWLIAALWVLALAVLEGLTWRTVAAPVREMMGDLGVEAARQVPRAVRALRDSIAACEAERLRTSALLEDITASLGDGLLVVNSELEIRLINRVARRFCGVETVTLGTHLLEILRNPDAVQAVESAATGGAPEPVVIENPRGLWEVHGPRRRYGGAAHRRRPRAPGGRVQASLRPGPQPRTALPPDRVADDG